MVHPMPSLVAPILPTAQLFHNYEAMLHINSQDTDGREAIATLERMIDSYWNEAKRFTIEEFYSYQDRYKRNCRTIQRLSGTYKGLRGPSATLSHDNLLNLAWPDYYQRVRTEHMLDVAKPFEERLFLLAHARDAFAQHEEFKDIPLFDRKIIGGFAPDTKQQHWQLFGGTLGAGVLKSLVARGNPRLSAAMAHIPLEGSCTAEAVQAFVSEFRRVFGKDGLGCGTRLLALKRPDLFLCINSRNSKTLSKAMKIRQSSLSGTDCWNVYLDAVLPSLRDCPWYITEKPSSEPEANARRKNGPGGQLALRSIDVTPSVYIG